MRTAFALAWVLVPGLLWAAPAAPEKDDQAVSPVERLRKDLDRPVTIKIEKQPLSAAIDVLREKTKLNLVLDGATIQQQLGFTPDQPNVPVQVDLKDVKARAALRTILQPYNLSYAIVGDAILVTTDDMAMYRQMHQRVSLDLDGVELAAALRQISRDTAVNLILDSRADKEASARVSLQAEDMPLETAVRLLAEMAGLKPVRAGNALFVTRKEIASELRNDPDFAPQGQPNMGTTYAATGYQTWVIGMVGMTPPSGPYLVHPAQYIPPSPAQSPDVKKADEAPKDAAPEQKEDK